MSTQKVECMAFKAHKNGSLVGFANIYIPKTGMEIFNCSFFCKEGRKWVNFPSREYQDADGEKKWLPLIRFREKEHQNIFNGLVIQAIEEWIAAHQDEMLHEVLPF